MQGVHRARDGNVGKFSRGVCKERVRADKQKQSYGIEKKKCNTSVESMVVEVEFHYLRSTFRMVHGGAFVGRLHNLAHAFTLRKSKGGVERASPLPWHATESGRRAYWWSGEGISTPLARHGKRTE